MMISIAKLLIKESPYPVVHHLPECERDAIEPYGFMDFLQMMAKGIRYIHHELKGVINHE